MAKFWRVDYEGELDKQFMLQQGKLGWPRDLSAEDREKFGKQMKVGDGVLLGRLRGKRGLVDGIGQITAKEAHPIKAYEISITWQAFPEMILMPDKTGLPRWKKYPVFKFAPAPVERYELEKLMEQHLEE